MVGALLHARIRAVAVKLTGNGQNGQMVKVNTSIDSETSCFRRDAEISSSDFAAGLRETVQP